MVQTTEGTLGEAVEQGEINTTLTLFNNPTTPNNHAAGLASNFLPAPPVANKLEWKNKLLSFEESTGTNLPPGLLVKRNLQNGRYLITTPQPAGSVDPLPAIRAFTGEASEELKYDVGVTFTPELVTDAKWSTGLFTGVTLERGVVNSQRYAHP